MLQAENGDKQPNFGSNYKQRTKGAYIEEALEQTSKLIQIIFILPSRQLLDQCEMFRYLKKKK